MKIRDDEKREMGVDEVEDGEMERVHKGDGRRGENDGVNRMDTSGKQKQGNGIDEQERKENMKRWKEWGKEMEEEKEDE